jgi:hypothetical protein
MGKSASAQNAKEMVKCKRRHQKNAVGARERDTQFR